MIAGESSADVLRPPGAKPEESFSSSCIRCFQCASVCPNRAIRAVGLERGLLEIFTPYIIPRDQACMLCMKCGDVCPTTALEKISDDGDEILAKVKMGIAMVDTSICYSYSGRICGTCYYACPYPDVALKLKTFAQPVVIEEKCVGCGLCERACIHIPQAIRVYPKEKRDA